MVIAEAEAALREPRIKRYLTDQEEAMRFLADVAAIADVVGDVERAPAVSRDRKDDVILETARIGRADVIVMGDDDLLVLREHEGIPIIAPRAFLGQVGAE